MTDISRRFVGRVAIVTGAARGIGFATSQRLVAEGAAVWLLDRRDDDVRAAAERLGVHATPMVVDQTDAAAVDAAVDTVIDRAGRLDVAVANAGWAVFRPFLDIDPVHWRQVMAANLDGTFNVAQACARAMIATGGGSIVLVGSITGSRPSRHFAHYAAAKAGVHALAEVMALELTGSGVRTNVVCPGYIATSATAGLDTAARAAVAAAVPAGRWGTPEEVAAAILFLASDEASYLSGTTLTTSGGTTSLDLREGAG